MSNEKIMSGIAGLERKRAYLVQFAASVAMVLKIQGLANISDRRDAQTKSDLQTLNSLLEQIDDCMKEIAVYANFLGCPAPSLSPAHC